MFTWPLLELLSFSSQDNNYSPPRGPGVDDEHGQADGSERGREYREESVLKKAKHIGMSAQTKIKGTKHMGASPAAVTGELWQSSADLEQHHTAVKLDMLVTDDALSSLLPSAVCNCHHCGRQPCLHCGARTEAVAKDR